MRQGRFKPCDTCGTVVYRKLCRMRPRTFCSRACYEVWWKIHRPVHQQGPNHYNWKGGKIERHCPGCNRTFYVGRNHVADTRKFCSLKCRGVHYSGERCHLWKGGISDERSKAKATVEYANWRKAVYARDHYKCIACLHHFRQLHAHHLKKYADYPELRFVVDNGVTLCRVCHGKVNRNEERFESFLRSRILRDFTSDSRLPVDLAKIKSELHGDMKRLAEMISPVALQ